MFYFSQLIFNIFTFPTIQYMYPLYSNAEQNNMQNCFSDVQQTFISIRARMTSEATVIDKNEYGGDHWRPLEKVEYEKFGISVEKREKTRIFVQ